MFKNVLNHRTRKSSNVKEGDDDEEEATPGHHKPRSRKRKFSGNSSASSRSSSYETVSSASNNNFVNESQQVTAAASTTTTTVNTNKKSRNYESSVEENDDEAGCLSYDNDLFSNQLLKLTNAAEEEGFSDLQAFVIENDYDADSNDNEHSSFNKCFRPCMIYLPVKHRLSDTLSIRVKLKPVDAEDKSKKCHIKSKPATHKYSEVNDESYASTAHLKP